MASKSLIGVRPVSVFPHNINGDKTEIDLKDESSGTFKLFGLLPHIIDSIFIGGTLVIDELVEELAAFLPDEYKSKYLSE